MYHSPLTQPLPEEQSPTADETGKNNKFGYLVINNCWYEIPVGETKIGRDASLCCVVLDDETVSKVHAVVESEGAEDTFIYDVGSINKTKIGKMKLRPHCRYKINDNDVIILGAISVKFKVISHKINNLTVNTPQFNYHAEGSIVSDTRLINSPSSDETNNGRSKNNSKSAEELCKSPSVSLLMAHKKQIQKHYYISDGEDIQDSDIFSQATQCVVTDTKQGKSIIASESDPLKSIDDVDIYNLSTQCEYPGDFLKPKDKALKSLTKKDTSTPKLENVRERIIDGDLNESGTFDFVKGNQIRNCIKSYLNDSVGEDIFDLDTQCQTKPICPISKDSDELNFKNKINQSVNFNEGVLTKNSNGREKDMYDKSVQEEDRNLMALSDGEDEKLCNLMRMNSPLINKYSSGDFKGDLTKTEFPDVSDEIFDISTQVPSKLTKGHNEQSITTSEVQKKHENSKRSETSLYSINHKSMPVEGRVLKTGMNLNKLEEAPVKVTTKGERNLDEDMILTQAFSASHHFLETKSENRSAEEKMSGGVFEIEKSTRRSDILEDIAEAKVFQHGNHPTLLDKQNPDPDIRHFSQDDIATQLFPLKLAVRSDGKLSDENQVLSVILEEAPPKPVPELMLLSDSGDETESDLEIKLSLESSSKGEKRKSSNIVKEDSEASKARDPDGYDRPSSGSSDKTLSDLDIAALEELGTKSLMERISGEDFIATQLFSGSTKEQFDKTRLDLERNFKAKKSEDFISTQICPVVSGGKSPSEISDKTESDIVVDTRPKGGYEINEASSEEDNCDIEDNSNESESLIKEIEDCSSSSPVLSTAKRVPASSSVCQNDNKKSLTLTPSHPVYETFSKVDGLMRKTSERSDSGIGAEHILDTDVLEKRKEGSLHNVRIASDSDETDCEEEMETMKDRFLRQETFLTAKRVDAETGYTNKTPLPLKVKSEGDHPSTSSVGSRKSGGPNKSAGKSVQSRRGPSKNTKKNKQESSIKKYFSPNGKEAMDSPLKRTLVLNSEEGIPKKKVKNFQSGKTKECEDVRKDEVILTQSLKLRNRIIRPRNTLDTTITKKKTPSETKTPGRGRQKPLIENASTVRKLVDDFEVLQEDSGKKGLRRRKSIRDDLKFIDSTAIKIVFTGFESDCHDKIIQKLGGMRVNHLDIGHTLVTDRVRRTVKFLSAVALGLPIVAPKWLIASEKEMKFLNPWNFFLEDKPSEERWGFNLKASVEKWKKQKLLKGYTVYATESTRPPVHEILSIVRCCGGSPMTSRPDIWPEKSILLTCVEDKKSWPPTKVRQVKIVHFEFLLSGVLRHFMDFNTYKLR